MERTHWIAVIAIIIPFITSWAQFWLKEHLEKRKAQKLKAEEQAALEVQRREAEVKNGDLFRSWPRHYLLVSFHRLQSIIIQGLFNLVALVLLMLQYRSTSPVTHGSVIRTAIIVAGWVYLTFIHHVTSIREHEQPENKF